jgi:hypothetical protein
MERHVKEAPPHPSANTDQPIPSSLEELILACLAKHLEERPKSADGLALAFLNSVEEAWTPARARTWWNETAAR